MRMRKREPMLLNKEQTLEVLIFYENEFLAIHIHRLTESKAQLCCHIMFQSKVPELDTTTKWCNVVSWLYVTTWDKIGLRSSQFLGEPKSKMWGKWEIRLNFRQTFISHSDYFHVLIFGFFWFSLFSPFLFQFCIGEICAVAAVAVGRRPMVTMR